MPDPAWIHAVGMAQLLLFLLVPVEILVAHVLKLRADYELADTVANLSVSFGSILCWGLLGWLYYGGVLFAYGHRLFDIPFSATSFLAAFVLDDCRYYWWHRISHRCRWFWASHVVHHSSQHFNLAVALRQSWTSQFTGLTLLNVPLAWIGFHPGTVALAFSVNLIYLFWIHTETIDRMPRWFEYLFNTPSHHRVHHGSNPRYLDANYAGVFMIWDRLFGTFVPEQREAPVRYGLVHDLTTFNPLRIATHEYVAMARDQWQPGLTLRQRLAYVFAPPGWSHDGSRATTEMLRQAEQARLGRTATAAGTAATMDEAATRQAIVPAR